MDKETLKTLFFIAVTVGLLLVSLCTPLGHLCTREAIIRHVQPIIAENKVKAVLLFVAAMTLLPMLWVPRLVMTAVAGALFGVEEGFVYAMIGSTTAGILGYYFAQATTSAYFERQLRGKKWVKYLDFTRSNAFWIILLTRICPITHYEIINYLCGTSNVRFGTFFWSTFLGIIPGTFVYVMMGDAILQGQSRDFWITMGILAVFFVVTTAGFYRIVLKGRKRSAVTTGAHPPTPAP